MPEVAPKMDRVGRLNLKEAPYLFTFLPKRLDKTTKLERAPYLSTFLDKHYKNLPFLFYSWKIPTIPRLFQDIEQTPAIPTNTQSQPRTQGDLCIREVSRDLNFHLVKYNFNWSECKY